MSHKQEAQRIRTISDFHRFQQLPPPEHPLVSVIDVSLLRPIEGMGIAKMIYDFYIIALKRECQAKFRYGQQEYDFDEGIMFFIAPNQVFSVEHTEEDIARRSGWMLLIHPDFLWNTPLAASIKQYEYFDYAVNEALFLSEKEEIIITDIIQNIRQEHHAHIDSLSQPIIIAQLELLLTYSERFYRRQFITRKIANHAILDRLEKILSNHFNRNDLIVTGLPRVQEIAEQLHVSPTYLSGLLKTLTGQSTQQHIHEKLIDKAKEKLSTTDLSVSEIAYELGFEHPQSFSKLFKAKTSLSPLNFRQSFN
jgi:AraC-like DNA-binding protein